MKCVNCSIDISPSFVAAITSNFCPSCGSNIMDTSQKELLDELSSAMKKMPNDPQGLAGWLLSNYVLQKIGDAEPTSFHRKQNQKEVLEEEDEDTPKLKIRNSKDRTELFKKRAGISRVVENNNEKFKGFVFNITEGNASIEDFQEAANNMSNEEGDEFKNLFADEMEEPTPLKKGETTKLSNLFDDSIPKFQLEDNSLENKIGGFRRSE